MRREGVRGLFGENINFKSTIEIEISLVLYSWTIHITWYLHSKIRMPNTCPSIWLHNSLMNNTFMRFFVSARNEINVTEIPVQTPSLFQWKSVATVSWHWTCWLQVKELSLYLAKQTLYSYRQSFYYLMRLQVFASRLKTS